MIMLKLLTVKEVLMKHRIVKMLLVLLVIIGVGAAFVFYGIYVAPEHYQITNESISSRKIPTALDNVSVAFISDIHYGEFTDNKRLKKMVDKINQASPDVVLFGGDLFTDALTVGANTEKVNYVTKELNDIKAPLGKFYVLGECDTKTVDSKTLVANILYNSGFEDLTNRNIKLHNGSATSVTLIGIDSLINGSPDIQNAFNGVSSDSFNIVFTHVPDELAQVPSTSADLAFAGHSHGGQVSIPFFGSLTSTDGADKFESGIHTVNNLTICISNGLGTTGVDMRLFSPAEIVIYRLISKS